jgi:glycosyltransferase involved in cell wall biosynthesis
MPTPLPGAARLRVAAKRRAFRAVRWALVLWARLPPIGRAGGDDRRVTILLWSAWGMGGTIRATLNFAGHLAASHEVEIVSAIRVREEPFFPLPDGVTVTCLDDRRPSAMPRLLRRLRGLLAARSSVLFTRHDRMYKDASLWIDVRLVAKLAGRRGFLIATRPALNLLAAELSPPGLVTIGQEQMHLRSHDRARQRAFRRWYPRLDALVVLTDLDRRRYDELLSGRVRLYSIPNTIRPNVGPVAPLEGTTILAAGRLTRQKGFDLLIAAFAQIAPERPDWRLRICGSGPWHERLERLAAEHGLSDRVSLPGPVEPLADEMNAAALFILSSRFEGFPLVLLEAMAKGMPVVAFDCPTGPGEVIDDHRNGLLVPAEDVDGLARAIAEATADTSLRRRLASEAARTASQYTIETVGPQWDALLAELGRSARQAPPTTSTTGWARFFGR